MADDSRAAEAGDGETPQAALLLFFQFLEELREARRREETVVLGFSFFLLLVTSMALLGAERDLSLFGLEGLAVVGLGVLWWRVNAFLSENRNRQNQIKKIITVTEQSYSLPQDRAYIRLTDLKNLDGPGEWDKSDYSLADWDRSDYALFLKMLVGVALLALLVGT